MKITFCISSTSVLAVSILSIVNAVKVESEFRPVVLWHGLGDTYDSVGMQRVSKIIEDVYPEIIVHSVYLDEDPSEDQKKSFVGNVNDEVLQICQQLGDIPQLQNGFDAIGFSQGGLFLRAYAERCNNPLLKTLITFGSPHNGISDLPLCKPRDFLCRQRNSLVKSQIWSSYAQTEVVFAQYFRNPEHLDEYLEYSGFLADLNNERFAEKNQTYSSNLATLERFVMVMFDNDDLVVPKESAWFQEVNATSGRVTPLEYRKLYQEDWIGLRKLGEAGKIDYLNFEGLHLEISDDQLRQIVKDYLGSRDTEYPSLFVQPSPGY